MRRYLVFASVSLALLLSSISGSAVSVAFPVIMVDLNTSLILAGWIMTGYQLVTTIVMPLAGKISEILGDKKAFIIYTLLFSIGSVLCAIAPNIYLLIGARVVQAIGGGGFMPAAAGIVSNEFPESRQRFIGLFSSIFPIGMIVGPNLGGWMVEAFGWQSIFWLNIPLGAIVLLFASILLRKDDRQKSKRKVDLVGAGLLFGTIFSLMFAITQFGNTSAGETPWIIVGISFALAIIFLFTFISWERRTDNPVVDTDLFRRRPFLAANIYNFVYGACALGIFSLVPLYAVSVYNMSTLQSGVILTPRSIGMMVASTVTSFFLVRWGYRRPIIIGTVIVIVCLFLLALQPHGFNLGGADIGVMTLLFIVVGLLGIGAGVCTPAANNACIELMPDKVATITGLRGTFRTLGSSCGIAIATVVIHNTTDAGHAFFIVFLASAILLLITLPVVLAMPASPNCEEVKQGGV